MLVDRLARVRHCTDPTSARQRRDAAGSRHRARASWPAAPTSCRTCAAASNAGDARRPPRHRRARHDRARSRDGTSIGAGVTLARSRADARIVTRLSGARAGGARSRRARASQRRDARRQPLPRHALRVLQPERMVARRQRLLPQAQRRHLPRRAAGRALPRGIQRRRRARADRARGRGRNASAHGTRRLPLAALYRDDGAAHLTLGAGELLVAVCICRPRRGAAPRRTGKRACAAASTFRWPAWRCRVAFDGARIADIAVALTGTNSHPLLLSGTDALVGRAVDDDAARARSASSSRSR